MKLGRKRESPPAEYLLQGSIREEEKMLHLAILLLASSCITLCAHIHRDYYLIKVPKSWAEAQSYCRENHKDLATVGSVADMKTLMNVTEASGITTEIWIGLRETGEASWLWSLRETQTAHGLVEYTNWFSLPNSSHHCGGMRDDGKWLSALCKTTLPFVCRGGESSDGLHVVLQAKSWREAQEYCRLSDSDLASVRNHAENQALQQMIHENVGTPSLIWMGLFRDEWKWSDQSDSSFRSWDSSQPNKDGSCTLYRPANKKWYDRACASRLPFICQVAERRKTIVAVELESSLDLSDPDVSEAILDQIQQKYEGVKLQWRVQPDGKIFHKKESKKRNDAC